MQYVFGIGNQFFQLGIRILRSGELYQLNLIKLVLTDQAAGISAGRTGLGTEACGISAIFYRQLCAV